MWLCVCNWVLFGPARHEIRGVSLVVVMPRRHQHWCLLVIFVVILDEMGRGHFAIVWSILSLPKYTAQNVKWVVIHCHHTCYPSSLCQSSSSKSCTCCWCGDQHECFVVLTNRNWLYQHSRTVAKKYHPKAWHLPAKEMIQQCFYNRCSELINWNWRSCQLKEIGWCESGHLWLLPHL